MGLLLDSNIWIEVLVGCAPGESEAVEVWLRGFHCLPLDGAVAREAADCRRALGLKVRDAIILATARCHQLRLATRNSRDFPEALAGVLVTYSL